MKQNIVFSLLVLLFTWVSGFAASANDSDVVAYDYLVGTQTFSPAYGFTTKSRIVETAEAIFAMGSNIFKGRYDTSAAVQAVLRMPFKYYFFWVRSNQLWANGFTALEKQTEYDAVYQLACSLLVAYNNTGKAFYFGHWEGDWYLLPGYNPDTIPTDIAIQGMIEWLNVRQQAVDDAEANIAHTNVQIYNYAEVNRVRDAMAGKRRMANMVIPYTNIDFVSYSSYDVMNLPQAVFDSTYDYVQSQLKPKAGLAGKRVFMGEYAHAAHKYAYNMARHDSANRAIMLKGLGWGAPFILYWEMYNNEVDTNGTQLGYWLIDDKNVKWPLYYTHQNLLAGGKEYVADFKTAQNRLPTIDEYRAWAIAWLKKPPAGLNAGNTRKYTGGAWSPVFTGRWVVFPFSAFPGSIRLYDIQGKQCGNMLIPGQGNTFCFSAQAPTGVYIMQIFNEQESAAKRFFLQ